jgi:Family of unknown function (DUF6263)
MKQVLLAAALFVITGITAQTYKPAVNLTQGKKYVITNVTKGSLSQEVMGQSMEIPMDVAITSSLEVKKAEGKEYQLSSTTDRIVMSMSMMGRDMNYDSDKKEDQQGEMGQAMGNVTGKPTSFVVNEYGKIKEGSIVKSTSPEKEAPGGNMMLGMMNMDEANETSQAINLFTSDAEIKVGDSFTDSSTSAHGKDKKSTTYTLAEIKDGAAKFTITGTAAVSNEMEMQGMQTVSNTNTKTTGEMWVNVTTGLLSKKTLNMTITGTIEVAGMSIPLSGTNTVTISVTEAVK